MVAAGSVLGARYVLRQPIGGGDAVVWRADDTASRQTVAVKVLDPPHGLDAQAAVRFLAEARALSEVDHPNVVRVIDHGQDGGVPYQVMPYVLGESLSGLLNRGGRLDPTRAMVLLAAVAEGLHAVGTAGVGHADLSPSDVILRLDGAPVLVGLGGAAPDSAAIVQAAGRLAYQCLTGSPPDAGDALAEFAEPVRAILARALTTDPSRRFPDPLALAAAARQAVGAAPVTRPAAPSAPVEVAPVRPAPAPPAEVLTVRSEPPPAEVLTVRSEPLAVPAPRSPPTVRPAPPAPPVPPPTGLLPTEPLPMPVSAVPALTAPRRPSRWRPALAAALVLLVLGAGTTAAHMLGLTPWAQPLADGSPSPAPSGTGSRTSPAPARTASRTPTATASVTPTVSPTQTVAPTPTARRSTAASRTSGGGNPPPPPPPTTPPPPPPTTPQTLAYLLAPLEFSPVTRDGSCVFRVVYGVYFVPFAEFHHFSGDCGTPTIRIAAFPPTGDWGWQNTPQESGTSAECGGYSWRRVVGAEGWKDPFGIEIVFPRTGNTHTYSVFGSVAPPTHGSC